MLCPSDLVVAPPETVSLMLIREILSIKILVLLQRLVFTNFYGAREKYLVVLNVMKNSYLFLHVLLRVVDCIVRFTEMF